MSNHISISPSYKAVICSVYGTLLECHPAPADSDQGWSRLWQDKFGRNPRMSLAEFSHAADLALHADFSIARARGVDTPAPYWPAVAAPLLPELEQLTRDDAAEFLYTHAQLRRTVTLAAGAGETLRELHAAGILLGLISNGHPHTPVELALALHTPHAPVESFIPQAAAHGVFPENSAVRELEIFTPPLCFWSFAHGFGKPNLHVFQHVATRLRARGIQPHEVLMVGENEGGDLVPARKFGWRTWRLLLTANDDDDDTRGRNAGNWPALARVLGLSSVAAGGH